MNTAYYIDLFIAFCFGGMFFLPIGYWLRWASEIAQMQDTGEIRLDGKVLQLKGVERRTYRTVDWS